MEPPSYRIADLAGCSRTHFLRAMLEAEGWVPTEGDRWNLFWSFELHADAVFESLTGTQRVNHFPGIASLATKDELHYCLAAAARRMEHLGLSDWLDFFPPSYAMPNDHAAFVEAATRYPERLWILKPKRLSAGRGIELITQLSQVKRSDEWLVQQYIADPLLLPDRPVKHVLRIFLLLTSLDPLVLYMHSTGLVKFTSRPYSREYESLSDAIVHFLHSYQQYGSVEDPVGIEDFHTYNGRLRALGIDDQLLWKKIRRLAVLTTVVHREPILGASLLRTERPDRCFELLGLDVIVDADLKPWLIECNMSPALAQQQSREGVLRDTLQLLGIAGRRDSHQPSDDSLKRFETELRRRGGFERIFPAADATEFLPFFQIERASDLALIRSST